MDHPLNAGNRRPIIGVLASWQVYTVTLNTLLSSVLAGIRDAALERDCDVLMACGVVSDFSTNIRTAWPLLSPDMDFLPVGPWNTDGLVIVAPHLSDPVQAEFIREMSASGHPLAFVETSEIGPSVCIDNKLGIYQALEHLKGHGHRQVAFIGGENSQSGDSFERLSAFESGCQEFELEYNPGLVREGHFTYPGGYAAMRQLLESGLPFSAVLASNDESAAGAMQALREAGRKIPQDVAIIGFDNRFESRTQEPPLTTINLPAYEIGWQSLELILQRVHGDEEAQSENIIRIPTQLVIRESCGCTPESIAQAAPAAGALERAEQISTAVFARVGQLHLESVRSLSAQLVEAFTESIDRGDPGPFQLALGEILEKVKPLDEDAHAWQMAIHFLRQDWLAHTSAGPAQAMVLEWLDAARMSIADCAQTQLLRYFSRQNQSTQQLSLMSAELSETIDLGSIQPILDRYVPGMGIRHARLLLFEPEETDPVAWSLGENPRRFPTRSFPPVGMYPPEASVQLALLPLVIQKKPAGFVAFEATNLYPCLAVVRQLNSTLENTRLYREAAEGRQLAEEANRLKSRFLSTVSHELRTPLNLIVSWSEMQLNESGQEASSFASRIHTSAQHLSRLIRDVLDLASSDAGQLRLICEPLDLGETLQMVMETGRQLASEKGLEWKTQIPERLPRIWGDRTRLQQITLNLISNAIKFTSRGWVKLEISLQDKWLEVAVSDTGLGILPAEQAWIFDEFRQSERTTSRGYGGLGLGLAIFKRLVELHGGEVGLISNGEEGQGSTFTYRLPVLEESEPAPQSQTQAVLVLTRQPESSEIIRKRLQRAGFMVEYQQVDEIPDWFSRILGSPPGAVILDEQLAVKYGWELLKVFKGNPNTANIPVLFYTLDQENDSGAMLTLDYLMKPVRAGELMAALARQGWTSAASGQAKTILVVDDDPGILEINARMLQENLPGHRILKASNGRIALEILGKVPVQLVLLDLMMPELDGFGVLAQMRERDATRETAVIVLTSKTLSEADMTRLNQGVAVVMSKGLYNVQEMLTHIETTLARTQRLGSDSQRLARKAMGYIHENFAHPITREDIAKYTNASDGHLARCFRQETGLSPMAYLNRYRVHQAQTLLSSTRQSITEVAMACGFSDANYFSRVFHQEMGQSPLAYRRKH